MTRTITVGLDGSPESRAAAEWAAREAQLRGLPLKILHVFELPPVPVAQAPLLGTETSQNWAEEWAQRMPLEAAEGLRLRHPGVEVITDQVTGEPSQTLAEAAEAAEMLVLGSRGLGGIDGFMVGSVSLSVITHATRPVVLVRAGEQAADEHRTDPVGIPSAATPFRPVVVGLDTGDMDETLLEFAFDAAARREAPLRIVHAWPELPTAFYRFYGDAELSDTLSRQHATALTEALRPWRQKFPHVDVIEASRCGSAAQVLVNAARDTSLAVVGRRIRTSPFGAHIGHVTHAVLHHVVAPVAVVAHA
ncbi:stress-inducible protein [Streptomyces sp. IMTB 2501]|uniref:universal stress protein n=1 Tax=Streptomyces sp. IMTB 2501 TaxID=1776340 RepID=UPI00096FB8F7|nr:universal stress protein [Streptomyces sp. IMTB 2501]OLZ58596.1 stress-inducible protein [Streptomyces sp. IMTB 2501]